MSSVSHLICGAFAYMGTAGFAVNPVDRIRAAEYLNEALAAGVRWPGAKKDIRDYLGSKGCDANAIQKEVNRARPLLEPWLKLSDAPQRKKEKGPVSLEVKPSPFA